MERSARNLQNESRKCQPCAVEHETAAQGSPQVVRHDAAALDQLELVLKEWTGQSLAPAEQPTTGQVRAEEPATVQELQEVPGRSGATAR